MDLRIARPSVRPKAITVTNRSAIMPDWYFEFYDPSGSPFRDRYKVKRGATLRVLENEDVLDEFDRRIDVEFDRPLLDRIGAATGMEKARLDEEIGRGRIHRWLTGENSPSEDNIQKVKQILGIKEGELPDPDSRRVRDIAVVETLMFIRNCRIPAADRSKREMTPDLYRVLEFVNTNVRHYFMERSAKRNEVMAMIASEVADDFRTADINTKDDLDELLLDWIGPFMILSDAINFRGST
jgi:hypothetical protein